MSRDSRSTSSAGSDRRDDVLDQLGPDVAAASVEARRVLRRDEHPLDRDRLEGVVASLVAHRDLRLAVGPQVRQRAVRLRTAASRAREAVGEHDRQRHPLRRLVAGVAEHHALVARALASRSAPRRLRLVAGVHALRDVGRLLVERDHDAAGVGVEAVLGVGVADVAHDGAHDGGDVDVASSS